MARESFEVPVVPATRDNTKNYGSGIICPPVGEELLGTYLRYLWSVGFMPLPTGQPVGAIHAAP